MSFATYDERTGNLYAIVEGGGPEELARNYARVPAWMVRAVLPAVRGVIKAKPVGVILGSRWACAIVSTGLELF